ncbi:LysR family transcriptional regulator [Halobacillus andaensis]|uniref:LysR family transcriptional regulator n=1 Tax=Halobacillus andaensis TaxID=1176239 RepID=UPI003D723810
MDIDQLRVFEMVVKEGSFSKAALQLNYSQSTITQKVKNLEVSLDSQLFYRESTGVKLTYEGERFFIYAIEVLEKTEAVKTDMKKTKAVSLKLRMGCTDVFNSSYPYFISSIMKQNQDMDVTLDLTTSEESVERLITHELDVAIVDHEIQRRGLYEIERFSDHIGIIHHKRFVINEWIDIAKRKILLLNLNCMYRQRMDDLLNHHNYISKPTYTKIGTIESILSCVNSDVGIALLPERSFNSLENKYTNTVFTPLPLSYSKVHHLMLTTSTIKKEVLSRLESSFAKQTNEMSLNHRIDVG